MNLRMSGAVLVAATAMLAQTPSRPPTLGLNTEEKLDELRRLGNQGKESGDLSAETFYLCQAAALDEKKFTKKCDHAKGDEAKALAQFEADLKMGRGEVQRKDYAGALRDLGRIKFGPNKAEAQQWMQQARVGLSGGVPVDPASLEAFDAARAAYNRGDFEPVEPLVKRIQSPVILAAANQFLANISAYRDAMNAADAMVHKGDLKGAEQKYQLAASIHRNGPGHPDERLREVQAAEARAAAAASQPQPVASAPLPPNSKTTQPSSKPNHAARSRNISVTTQKEIANGEVKGPTQASNAGGNLDAQRGEDRAGTLGTVDQTQTPSGSDDDLKEAIKEFYASHFSQAADAIEIYLQEGEQRHAGAAHFYKGASLLAQALLTSPKDQPRADALRLQAEKEFDLARQMRYKPIEAAVSPKILAQWTQPGDK
jgi:hypothetical protein